MSLVLDLRDIFVEKAEAYCAALKTYDGSANPHNLREMTLARHSMREVYDRFCLAKDEAKAVRAEYDENWDPA